MASSVLEDPEVLVTEVDGVPVTTEELTAASKVQQKYRGVRLARRSMPYSRKVSAAQKAEAAKLFNMSSDGLSMSKRLFDAKEPAVKEVRAAVSAVNAWFRDRRYTLPWDEPGVRQLKKGCSMLDGEFEIIQDSPNGPSDHLIRYKGSDGRIRTTIVLGEDYEGRVMTGFQFFRSELLRRIETVRKMARRLAMEMPAIKERQRKKLGSTFNPADYDFDAENAFDVEIAWPSLHPDPELASLDPEAFAEEQKRLQEMHVRAVRAEKSEMAENMIKMLDGLALALSDRRLLDGEHEVLFTRQVNEGFWGIRKGSGSKVKEYVEDSFEELEQETVVRPGDVIVTFRRNNKEEQLLLHADEVRSRIALDDKKRKFNDSTATRIFVALEEADARAKELGITSDGLESAFGKIRRMVRGDDINTFANSLRSNEDRRVQVMAAAAQIATQMFDMAEVAPRRTIIRKQLKAETLREAT